MILEAGERRRKGDTKMQYPLITLSSAPTGIRKKWWYKKSTLTGAKSQETQLWCYLCSNDMMGPHTKV